MSSRELERFKARSDDGKYETVVIVSQRMIEMPIRENPNRTVPGPRRARTIDGFPCTILEDGGYQILDDPSNPGVIVRRTKERVEE